VALPQAEIGRLAMTSLIRLAQGPLAARQANQPLQVDSTFILRGSTAPPRLLLGGPSLQDQADHRAMRGVVDMQSKGG